MVAGKIGAVADRRVRMASKTAGAAEKMNGAAARWRIWRSRRMKRRRSGRLSAKKTEDVAEKTEDDCDKFAPMSQVVGTRVAQLFAQAGDVQMVSK